jgi:hypothetical protein
VSGNPEDLAEAFDFWFQRVAAGGGGGAGGGGEGGEGGDGGDGGGGGGETRGGGGGVLGGLGYYDVWAPDMTAVYAVKSAVDEFARRHRRRYVISITRSRA